MGNFGALQAFILILVSVKAYIEFHENHHQHKDSDYEKKVLGATGSLSELTEHFKNFDTNHDGKLDLDEITGVVYEHFLREDMAEAMSKMAEVDENQDGKVQWKEYLKKVYDLDNTDSLLSDLSEQNIQLLKIVQEDEARFKAADVGSACRGGGVKEKKEGIAKKDEGVGDGALDVCEYASFLQPTRHPHMRHYELDVVLTRLDTNLDGVISFDEYLAGAELSEKEKKEEREIFSRFDHDSDGKLDRTELTEWLLPEQHSLARQKAQHLLSEMDSDLDQHLTPSEVMLHFSQWRPLMHHLPLHEEL